MGWLPIWKELYDDPEVKESLTVLDACGKQFEYVEVVPRDEYSTQRMYILIDHIQAAILGKEDIQDALDSAASEMEQYVHK